MGSYLHLMLYLKTKIKGIYLNTNENDYLPLGEGR